MYTQTQATVNSMLYQVTHGAANNQDWNTLRDNITFITEPTSLHNAPQDVPLIVVTSELVIQELNGETYNSKVILGGSSVVKLSSETALYSFRDRTKRDKLTDKIYLVALDQTYKSQYQGREEHVPSALKPEYIYCNTDKVEEGLVIPLNHILQDGKPLLSSGDSFEFSGTLKVFNLLCLDAYCYDNSHSREDVRYLCHLIPSMRVSVTMQTLNSDKTEWVSGKTFLIYPDYSTACPKLNSQNIIEEFLRRGDFWTSQLEWYKNMFLDIEEVEALIGDVDFEDFYKVLYQSIPSEVLLQGGFGFKSAAAYLLRLLGEETFVELIGLYQDECLSAEVLYDVLPVSLYSSVKEQDFTRA